MGSKVRMRGKAKRVDDLKGQHSNESPEETSDHATADHARVADSPGQSQAARGPDHGKDARMGQEEQDEPPLGIL